MQAILLRSFTIFLIIFSCVAYGSVNILPTAVIETTVAAMVLFWIISLSLKRRVSFSRTGLFMPAAFFACLVIVQLVYLPAILVRILSPGTFNLYANFTPSGALKSFSSLSICPDATVGELCKLLSLVGIFFLIVNTVNTKRDIDILLNVIIFFGMLISMFGIIQKYSYPDRVYWFDTPGSAATPFGPFFNRNNFAGYINMIIPLAIGYFLTNIQLARRVIYGLAIGIMSSALLLSISRAGALVYIITLLFFVILSRFKQHFRKNDRVFFIWAIMILCAMVFLSRSQVVVQRLSTLLRRDSFLVIGHGYPWADILRMWQDFPFFGTGLGTFGNISSMYKTYPSQALFTYAHNDYLQLLSETGIVGFGLVSWFFFVYFNSVLRQWLERHDTHIVCLVLGGIASLFSILAYSLLDFNLHIPANAVLFSIILGLIFRLAFIRPDRQGGLAEAGEGA